MREEKVFRLGKLTIDGDLISFEAAPELDFTASRADLIHVGVYYDYSEITDDKEKATIRLSAQLDGGKAEAHDVHIADNPLADDSRRGFVSVPIRAAGRGELRGRFTIEAIYESGPWRAKASDFETRERAEGEFTLRVS